MNYKQIEEELAGLQDLKTIMITYQEIAASRMQRVKDSVLRNRRFLDEVREIYLELRTSYRAELSKILDRRKKTDDAQDYSILTHSNQSVTVLLSSNTKLYGDIINKTFKRFLDEVKSKETDIVIVGKVGLQMYKTSDVNKEYTFFDLSDGIKDDETVHKIIEAFKSYKEISVIHGKFENILNQQADETIVSTENAFEKTAEADTEEGDQPAMTRYLFEPSLEEILLFFETEILAALLEQTVYESNLSKFTSRMISLDKTVDNINQEVTKTKFRERQYKHRQIKQKHLDSLAGITLWNS